MSDESEGMVTTGPPGETKTVPICANPGMAIQVAVSARRGQLVRAGGVPKAADLNDEDINKLFGVIEHLIDELGATEWWLKGEQEIRRDLEREMESLLESIRSAKQTGNHALREARAQATHIEQTAQERRLGDRS